MRICCQAPGSNSDICCSSLASPQATAGVSGRLLDSAATSRPDRLACSKLEVDGSPVSRARQLAGARDRLLSRRSAHWYGLAGVDVEAKPGKYSLELEATLPDGKLIHEQRTVLVERCQVQNRKLRVPQRYVKPDPETLRRIEADKEIKKTAFAHEIAEPSGRASFDPPIDTTVSEGFGRGAPSTASSPAFIAAWTITPSPARR